MKSSLSLVIITKNSGELLTQCLDSVKGVVDEIVLVDDRSKDSTLEIAKKNHARIFSRRERDLGKQKAYGLRQARSEWILFLDSDEIVSPSLKKEIRKAICDKKTVAYRIPYENHFLGKPVRHGGENYAMIRLFKKKYAVSHQSLVHEKVEIKGKNIERLHNKIHHYSYRSLSQVYGKFTDYAVRDAEQKMKQGEKSSIKKIMLYPIHMFWSRFIEDKGYKDGFFRIPLDLGFAYMEFLTYVLLFFNQQ